MVIGGILAIVMSIAISVALIAESKRARRLRKGRPPPVLIGRAKLAALSVPSLALSATQTPGFSKIGGSPELSPDLNWPQGEKGLRTFLIQLDLGEAKAWGGPDWLPPQGRIYAFVDEERGGFADNVSVLFGEETPSGPQEGRGARTYPERRLKGRRYMSFPSPDWLGMDGVEGEQDGLDEFVIEPAPIGREGMHRVGGFPSEIQGGRMDLECEYLARGVDQDYETETPPEIEEAAKSWRMLLQIDSDRELKMNWGDGGRFYIFIREEDARAGDFSKTVTISQTY